MYEGGPPSAVSGTAKFIITMNHENQTKLQCRSEIERKTFYIPGSLLSANDQLDKGPVMLRTATQTSSKEMHR